VGTAAQKREDAEDQIGRGQQHRGGPEDEAGERVASREQLLQVGSVVAPGQSWGQRPEDPDGVEYGAHQEEGHGAHEAELRGVAVGEERLTDARQGRDREENAENDGHGWRHLGVAQDAEQHE